MKHPDGQSSSQQALLHFKRQDIEKKDFKSEVRGVRDITSLMDNNTKVILDMNETSLSAIVDKIMDAIMDNMMEVGKEEILNHIFSTKCRTILSNIIQSVDSDEEQSWICSSVEIPKLQIRKVGIARLKHPSNFGPGAEEIQFFVLILCPKEIKATKSALETGRTFATLICDPDFRQKLLELDTEESFKKALKNRTFNLAEKENQKITSTDILNNEEGISWFHLGKGVMLDVKRRLPFYVDDFRDGIVGQKTISKVIATTFFLYFSVILPAVALGVLNSVNTKGKISVQQVIVGQVLGGMTYAFLAGQPLLVVMTTAPSALFIKIIYYIAEDFQVDFLAFYGMVGLWNTFFLILYSCFNLSRFMRHATRSTEEIFSNFIAISFAVDAFKNMAKNFKKNYSNNAMKLGNFQPDKSLLSLILMFGTVWFGVSLLEFTKTPFLSKSKRQMLSDYALPVSVIVFSIFGQVIFANIKVQTFPYVMSDNVFQLVDLTSLSSGAILGAMGLGFSLSLLFFLDGYLAAAMVNSPENKLRKGTSYHWDLLIIGLINAILSIFGFPFIHAVLPHSPLHVKCLADTEDVVENGYVRSVVIKVRETRLTSIFSTLLMALSLFFIGQVLVYIPTAVLDGLFLYLAVISLYGNQMFERILLLIKDQSAYPPNSYIRQVPQRKIHIFTICQVIQLLFLCAIVFSPWPYTKMAFPILILTFLPIRRKILPILIEEKYLSVLDGH